MVDYSLLLTVMCIHCMYISMLLFFSFPVMQAVTVSSQQIPRSLIAPLVSILLHESEPPENLTWSSMATLSELGKLGRGIYKDALGCECVHVCVCVFVIA